MVYKIAAFLLLFRFTIFDIVNAQNDRCFTPERNIGNCINIKQCPSLLKKLTSPNRQQSDIDYLIDSRCGYENITPKVCCPLQSIPNYVSHTGFEQQVDKVNLLSGECQFMSVRIFSGIYTRFEEFPWMALLQYSGPNGTITACGGTLINKRYVLTAAHCINGKSLPKTWKLESVRLGEYNTATDRDCVPEGFDKGLECADDPVTIRIEEKIAHEDYDPLSNNQRYDIALLRLNRDVLFTEYIKPICLPKTSNIPSKLVAVGWGSTESRKESDIKLKVYLPLVDMRECSAVYQRNGVTLGESQFCVGGQKGYNSCRADSGGPLMQQEPGEAPDFLPRWTVHGIMSFGPSPCNMEGFPGVYTKVYNHIPWIKRNIRA